MTNKHNHQGREWTFGEKWRCFAIMCTEHCFVHQSGKNKFNFDNFICCSFFFLTKIKCRSVKVLFNVYQTTRCAEFHRNFPSARVANQLLIQKTFEIFGGNLRPSTNPAILIAFMRNSPNNHPVAKLIKPMKKILGK